MKGNYLLFFQRFVGTYVNILIRVIVHDTLQFLIVLGVIIISFGGGLFFSLHGEPALSNQQLLVLGKPLIL